MTHEFNHRRPTSAGYVKEPGVLIELVHHVIEAIEAKCDDAQVAAMEAQLREVAKAIDNLDRKNIAVPDALRAEKTRLAAALSIQAQAVQALNLLSGEFDEIAKDLKARLGREEPAMGKTPRNKRSRSPKTDKNTLRQLILEALQHLGGSSHKNNVLEYMGKQLDGKLLPGDLEWRESTKDFAWKNNACWERFSMIEDGLLKSGSPRGIWELNQKQQ